MAERVSVVTINEW